jgi:hypothetical protein
VTRRVSARRVGFWAIVVGVVVVGLAAVIRERFQVDGATTFSLFDEAMISMRYGRNLANGHGLVWNVGDPHPVEGYTNLSWTVWMAVLHLAPVSAGAVSLLVMLSGLGLIVVVLPARWHPGAATRPHRLSGAATRPRDRRVR